MKLFRLKGEYYLLSTDDIKKGDIFLFNKKELMEAKNDINVHNNYSHYKVIAATNEYSNNKFSIKNSNNILLLDKEKIEKLLGIEIEKCSHCGSIVQQLLLSSNWICSNCYIGFGDLPTNRWVNQKYFREIEEKKFTTEDIEKMFFKGFDLGVLHSSEGDTREIDIQGMIKSLEESKNEWDVEIETEVVSDFENSDRDNDGQIFNSMRKIIPVVTNGFINILNIK